MNDMNSLLAMLSSDNDVSDGNSQEEVTIRGPYGPEWPFVTEPVEFEIGTAKVKIEIEDENAKFPMVWTLLADANNLRASQESFRTFCAWMDINNAEIIPLREQTMQISEIKPFSFNFQPINTSVRAAAAPTRRTLRGSNVATRTASVTKPTTLSPSVNLTDMAKLLHSSLLEHRYPCQTNNRKLNKKRVCLEIYGDVGF